MSLWNLIPKHHNKNKQMEEQEGATWPNIHGHLRAFTNLILKFPWNHTDEVLHATKG